MIGIVFAAVVMFADATPAAAPAAAPAPAPAAAPAKPATGMTVDKASNDFVCHNEEVLGTRFTKKVCRSRSMAEEDKNESRRSLEYMQQNSLAPKGN